MKKENIQTKKKIVDTLSYELRNHANKRHQRIVNGYKNFYSTKQILIDTSLQNKANNRYFTQKILIRIISHN